MVELSVSSIRFVGIGLALIHIIASVCTITIIIVEITILVLFICQLAGVVGSCRTIFISLIVMV